MSNDGNPFAPNNFGIDPLDEENKGTVGPKCPGCKKQNFHAWTNQYGLMRRCNECGNEWSGGVVSKMDLSERVPPKGMPAPEDMPVVQYTGAGFRDPSKTFDSDDE